MAKNARQMLVLLSVWSMVFKHKALKLIIRTFCVLITDGFRSLHAGTQIKMYSCIYLKKNAQKHTSSLNPNREQHRWVEQLMMRDGKGNLNWPLAVVLFRFALSKQANATVNTKKKEKQLQCFLTWERRQKEVNNFIKESK